MLRSNKHTFDLDSKNRSLSVITEIRQWLENTLCISRNLIFDSYAQKNNRKER